MAKKRKKTAVSKKAETPFIKDLGPPDVAEAEVVKPPAPTPTSRLLAFRSPESSIIRGAEYSLETQSLVVTFHSADKDPPKRFLYPRVPADVFAKFAAAESKGAFFMREIRQKYNGERV